MLTRLHVKNLALIEEEEIFFSDGLNIMTGETGAGKSVVIGSIGLAMGGKADRNFIRQGAEYALVEMEFSLDHREQADRLHEMELEEEDGTVLIKRKIYPGRNICSVCGETVTLRQLREVGELLIDVYGQRENQKLLQPGQQRAAVDEYAGKEADALLEKVHDLYREHHRLLQKWEEQDLDEAVRMRELDLCRYEADEIRAAGLKEGEDELLEEHFRILNGFEKITQAASAAENYIAEENGGARSRAERALRELQSVRGYDGELDRICAQLEDAEALLADFHRSLSGYLEDLSFDQEEFVRIGERLDLINHLKGKYGNTAEAIQKTLEQRQKRILELEDYARFRKQLEQEMLTGKQELENFCEELSALRRRAAERFSEEMRKAMLGLNFNHVEFQIRVEEDRDKMTEKGWDRVEFLISLNEGESVRPLEQIASGGELSRIMLAMKTVFAENEGVHTFIFDEIDSGISGQTAWKVAEKLGEIARHHQILCITHLPQIAAMGDSHYRIRKEENEGRTLTHITKLDQRMSRDEMARLLGGACITETVLANADEMIQQARQVKNEYL